MWILTEKGFAINLAHASHLVAHRLDDGQWAVQAYLSTRPYDSPTYVRAFDTQERALNFIKDVTSSSNSGTIRPF